jgi:hypothetical protein
MPLPISKKLETYLSLSVGATTAGTATLAEAEVLFWNGPPVTVQPSAPNFVTNIVWSVSTMTASSTYRRYNANVPTSFYITYQRTNYIYTNTVNQMGLVVTNAGGNSQPLARMSLGDTVGPASSWGNPNWGYMNNSGWNYSATHPWATGTDNTRGHIGFYYAQGSDRNYGWASFTYNNGEIQSLTLNAFAYETTPNTAITIQPVPEPTTLGLMVSGAAGIAALRRRRQKPSG